MKSLWLVDKLSKNELERATSRYLRQLARAPSIASRQATVRMLHEMRSTPGAKVHFGRTPWGEAVDVPVADIVRAVGLTTGGMGAGKTMAACLVLEALIRQMPELDTMSFGVIDPKGELFERALWILAWRLEQLPPARRERLLERIVVIDFASRSALAPYNILSRWPYAEKDYFIHTRLDTLRDLLPAGEKLSLRGANVLKYAVELLSEFNLPLTCLDRLLTSDAFRSRLVSESRNADLRYYFSRHFATEGKQTVAALRARMDALFASEGVRLALAGSSAPDFRTLQNEGKIVLINLSGPTIARGVRLLLQGLVLADIRQSIFARPNNPRVTYLWLADEGQNFFLTRQQVENMPDLFNMARAYGSFFYLLCQNLSTAVSDSRILEMLYTNIRWALHLRGSPHDVAYLKPALPITGRLQKPEPNPFQEPSFYRPEEERTIAWNGVASLPDREGYLWLRTRSAEAIRIRTPEIRIPQGEEFRAVVDELRESPEFGNRLSRQAYERLVEERDGRFSGPGSDAPDLRTKFEEAYRAQEAGQ